MSEWETFRDRILRERPATRREYERLEPVYRLVSDLIRLRHECGVTQGELARRVGTRQPAIARLEAGRAVPSLDLVCRLADALDADVRVQVEPRRNARAVVAQRRRPAARASSARRPAIRRRK
jgi:transcriptional regulator with XRE-family HTH domain